MMYEKMILSDGNRLFELNKRFPKKNWYAFLILEQSSVGIKNVEKTIIINIFMDFKTTYLKYIYYTYKYII